MVALEALGQLIIRLTSIAVDYATAKAERRAQLLAEAKVHFEAFLDRLSHIDEDVAHNNATVDAEAKKKFEKAETTKVDKHLADKVDADS